MGGQPGRSVHSGDSTGKVFTNKMNEDSEQFSIFLTNLVIIFLFAFARRFAFLGVPIEPRFYL